MSGGFLTALPVYNEAAHVHSVLDQVCRYSREVLVVDDGSRDQTPALLRQRSDIRVIRHSRNRGYGAALRTAFEFAIEQGYEILVTIDCDRQHEPQRIPLFVQECRKPGVDIVSGSRYLARFPGDTPPPPERRRINHHITQLLNRHLGLGLTDAFCGFKAYRVEALRRLRITEPGYGMPLEVWIQAAHHRLHVVELPVPLIYLPEERSFGGRLDDPDHRLRYYYRVIQRALGAVERPAEALQALLEEVAL